MKMPLIISAVIGAALLLVNGATVLANTQDKIPLPYVVKDACIGEACVKYSGKSISLEWGVALSNYLDPSSVVFVVNKGQRLFASNNAVVTYRPVFLKSKNQCTIDKTVSLEKNERISVLYPVGEGCHATLIKGKISPICLKQPAGDPNVQSCFESPQWDGYSYRNVIYVTNAQGKSGWIDRGMLEWDDGLSNMPLAEIDWLPLQLGEKVFDFRYTTEGVFEVRLLDRQIKKVRIPAYKATGLYPDKLLVSTTKMVSATKAFSIQQYIITCISNGKVDLCNDMYLLQVGYDNIRLGDPTLVKIGSVKGVPPYVKISNFGNATNDSTIKQEIRIETQTGKLLDDAAPKVIDQEACSTGKVQEAKVLTEPDSEGNMAWNGAIDGDTLLVEIAGRKEQVRLINIDTPEIVAYKKSDQQTTETRKFYLAPPCNQLSGVTPGMNDSLGIDLGRHSRWYVKTVLSGQKTLWLERDQGGSDRDNYQRLLRYVYLTDPCKYPAISLNERLLEAGYGRYLPGQWQNERYIPFSEKEYSQRFRASEARAKKEGKGFWNQWIRLIPQSQADKLARDESDCPTNLKK